MKGQIVFGRRCSRCNREVSEDTYARNNGYCDSCIVQVNLELPDRLPSGRRMAPEWVHCPNCGADTNLRSYAPPYTCYQCHYLFNLTACPQCHRTIDSNAQGCNHCGWTNRGFTDTRVRLTKTMSKKVLAKLYETVIFEIIGAFLILGMPFIGLPSMPFLAVAIMALLPLYNFLPNESELLASRQRNVESLGGEATTYLVLKSMSKLMMFFFSVAQFVILPVSKLIPLGISFFYYFTLPVSYKTTEPFKMLEAWIRPFGVGPLIAIFIYWGFLGSSQAMSLALMSAAFFCTSFPRHRCQEEGDRGQVNVALINGNGRAARFLRGQEGMYQDQFLSIIFLILMTLSLSYSQVGLSVNFSAAIFSTIFFASLLLIINVQPNHVILLIIAATVIFGFVYGGFSGEMIQMMFFAVWELSVITGLAGGKETRPAVGILMIVMTLVVFSFTATGVMGTSVFGYWWPQIESTVEAIAAPIMPMLEQVQSGMGDAWLMMTNPMGYYDQMNKKNQVARSVVKEGGTTKSIELLKTDLFTSTPGELEPILDPLVGSFQIQNQGEYNANRIAFKLWASWQDPKEVALVGQTIGPQLTGTLSELKCSQTYNTCNGASNQIGEGCWTATTYPSEIRFINFVYEKNQWDIVGSTTNLANCVSGSCTDSVDCCDTQIYPNATYVHSGQQVKFNLNLTYDYNVNVSILAEVMNLKKYRDFLLAKQIDLKELTSQYTGGPVKATLWSQRQPIRSDETSLFVASLYNEGGGTLEKVNKFYVLIPKELVDYGNIEIVAQTFEKTKGNYNGCGDFPSGGAPLRPDDGADPKYNLPNYWVISCVHNVKMKNGEYKRVSFFIQPPAAGNIITDSRTFLIVGLANYEYTKTGSTGITIANAPWH